jgi:hypothetical protein
MYLLLLKHKFKIVGPISSAEINSAEAFFKKSGYTVFRMASLPTEEELARWQRIGYGRCLDGCYTRGLASCAKHGSRSWLSIYKHMG